MTAIPRIPAPPRRITQFALLSRITQAEQVMIELASLDSPAASMPERAQAAAIRCEMRRMLAAEWVDLDDPALVAGLQQFEQAGLLAEGRAAEITGPDARPDEVPSWL